MTTILPDEWPSFDSDFVKLTLKPFTSFDINFHINRLKLDGYTIFKQLLPHDIFPTLNDVFDDLKSNQLKPVGIVTHPMYWAITQALNDIVLQLLNEPYHVLPETWAWDIEPGKHQKGWAPHREKAFSTVRSDNRPNSVSLWIPITSATPENSCMYVLPACDDPNYPVGPTSFEYPLQSIRALPAEPGDVIVFNHNLIHWGSQSSQWASHPRRAMAYECQISSQVPYNNPVFDPMLVPDHATCVHLYHQLIGQYDHINY